MNNSMHYDEVFMTRALAEAKKAAAFGEVPVGAILVGEGLEVATYNRREENQNALHHAEILAIDKVAQLRKNWRLEGFTLYVTLEPCLMCAGAILQSRLSRLVFAALDPKGGAIVSQIKSFEHAQWNHTPEIHYGLFAIESRQILQSFFQQLRGKTSAPAK